MVEDGATTSIVDGGAIFCSSASLLETCGPSGHAEVALLSSLVRVPS
jgi:hypothetical protein